MIYRYYTAMGTFTVFKNHKAAPSKSGRLCMLFGKRVYFRAQDMKYNKYR